MRLSHTGDPGTGVCHARQEAQKRKPPERLGTLGGYGCNSWGRAATGIGPVQPQGTVPAPTLPQQYAMRQLTNEHPSVSLRDPLQEALQASRKTARGPDNTKADPRQRRRNPMHRAGLSKLTVAGTLISTSRARGQIFFGQVLAEQESNDHPAGLLRRNVGAADAQVPAHNLVVRQLAAVQLRSRAQPPRAALPAPSG